MIHDRPTVGILLTLLGIGLLTGNDAVIKLLAGRLPVGEVVLLQALLVLAVLGGVALRVGWRRVAMVAHPRTQILRSSLNALSMVCFVAALPHMPLLTVATLASTSPLFVGALSPWLLGERTDGIRALAVLVGFGGVVLAANPPTGSLSPIVLLPIGSALCTALRDIVTRRLAATDRSEATLLYSIALIIPASFALTGGNLAVPGRIDAALILFASAAYLGALWCLIEAMRFGEVATMTPFKFTGLVWAVIFDIVLFGRLPALNVVAGAIIIVMAMIAIVRRERAAAEACAACGDA